MINQSKKHFFRSISIMVLLLGMVIFGAVQQADAALIQFSIGNGGSISYAGTRGSLSGHVAVTNVIGNDTPSNSGSSLVIDSGFLNFITGNLIGDVVGNTWTFAPGTINLIGGISAMGIANGTTLMSGTFNSEIIVQWYGPYFNIVSGGFDDTKNITLTNYYGLPSSAYLGAFGLNFAAIRGLNDSLTSTAIYGGTLTNTPVPVPPSLLLLGTGLAGFIVLRRKISKK